MPSLRVLTGPKKISFDRGYDGKVLMVLMVLVHVGSVMFLEPAMLVLVRARRPNAIVSRASSSALIWKMQRCCNGT